MNCYQRVSKKPNKLCAFNEHPLRTYWYHYKLLHHFSSFTNAAMQRWLKISLSFSHIPNAYLCTHILPPFHSHRHLMRAFHNVLRDIRNCFKRLITITVFLYCFTDCRDSLKVELPFYTLSSDKAQNHDLQTCTMFLSSFKNIVQS